MKNYYKMMLRNSLILLTLLFGVIFAAATAVVWKLGLNLWGGIAVSVLIVGIQYLMGPATIDMVYKVEFVIGKSIEYKAEELFLEKDVVQFIKQTCHEINIPVPKIGIIRDGNPNAFTYGHIPKDAKLVVTTGLINILTKEEQKSVIAHELGHIKHCDFIAMTIVSLIPMIFYQIYISTKKDQSDSADIIGVGAYIIYILSGFIVLCFSRIREYYADKFSKKIIGSGEPLKSALIKITYGTASRDKDKKPKTSCMGFTNNIQNDAMMLYSYKQSDNNKLDEKLIKWDFKNLWGKWYEANSTHPLTAKRILALDDKKVKNIRCSSGEIVRFLIEAFIKALPFMILLVLGMMYSIDIHYINLHNEKIKMCYKVWIILKNNPLGIILFGISILIKYYYSYRKGYEEYKINELLVREDASPVKGIPAIIKGKIIGRGIPGLFYSEDLVLDDGTGIILIDYKQPLKIFEILFGVEVDYIIEKDVEVVGWYKRSTMPYFVSRYIIVDDDKTICFNYILKQVLGYSMIIAGIVFYLI